MGIAQRYGKFLLLETDFDRFKEIEKTVTPFKKFIKESRQKGFKIIDTYFDYADDFNCAFEVYETHDGEYYTVVFCFCFPYIYDFSQKSMYFILNTEGWFNVNGFDRYNVFKHLITTLNYKKLGKFSLACSKKLLFKKKNFYNYQEFIYLIHELLKINFNFTKNTINIIGVMAPFGRVPLISLAIKDATAFRKEHLKKLLNLSVNNMMLYLIEASMEYQMHEREIKLNIKRKQIDAPNDKK